MTKLNLTRRSTLAAGLVVAAALVAGSPSRASDFPDRQVTMVVPFAAGGSTDVVARILAQKMSEDLGQQVIVQNVAGAGGFIPRPEDRPVTKFERKGLAVGREITDLAYGRT